MFTLTGKVSASLILSLSAAFFIFESVNLGLSYRALHNVLSCNTQNDDKMDWRTDVLLLLLTTGYEALRIITPAHPGCFVSVGE